MTKGSNTWKGAPVYPQLVTLLSSPPSRGIYISSEGARNNLWSLQADCLHTNTTQCNSRFHVSLPPSNPLLPVFLPERDFWLRASFLPLDAGWTPSSNGNVWVWQTWPGKLGSLGHLASLAQRWELWHEVCTERHDSWQLLRVLQRNICPRIAFIRRLVHASEVAQKSLKLILFLSFSLLPSPSPSFSFFTFYELFKLWKPFKPKWTMISTLPQKKTEIKKGWYLQSCFFWPCPQTLKNI